MAVPFCQMRPELRRELVATKAAMVSLRRVLSVLATGPGAQTTGTRVARPSLSVEQIEAGRQLLDLDRAFRAATGTVLRSRKGHPEYTGPMYQWPVSRRQIAHRTIQALERLRDGQSGCHPQTAHVGRHYFASIWPEGTPWPADIPRPTPETPSSSPKETL